MSPSEEDLKNKNRKLSPEITADENILKQYNEMAGNQLIGMIADAIPDVAMILTHERRVVYQNIALLELAGEKGRDSFLGVLPGDIFDCINASSGGESCGHTESCRFCGSLNAILECQRTGKPSNRECRITSENNGNTRSYDLMVNASPFSFNGNDYVIFSIKDISDQKRRKILERMFFHDVLNSASGISGMLMAIKGSSDPGEMAEYIKVAEKASNDLIEDLVSQRALSAAENGDLRIHISRFSTIQVLHEIAAYLSHHEIAADKRIHVDPFSHSFIIESDQQLLKRVLINLVKNALEASQKGSVITLASKINNDFIVFTVSNPAPMSVEVQKQIFQRSFSTKGADRGIGTYSVKLLTTRYLGGTVSFYSDNENGTTFVIRLPLTLNQYTSF